MTAWGQTASRPEAPAPATPIKHMVVIFPENISFDHYFGTYPHATNPPGEPKFVASPNTPMVNGLSPGASHPQCERCESGERRGCDQSISPRSSQAATADQDHAYTPEQMAFHAGLDGSLSEIGGQGDNPAGEPDYSTKHNRTHDGLFRWQHGYRDVELRPALCHERQFVRLHVRTIYARRDQPGIRTDERRRRYPQWKGRSCRWRQWLIYTDQRSRPGRRRLLVTTRMLVSMSGNNIGNLLNEANVTWGWFSGGFDRAITNENGTTDCKRTSQFPPISAKAMSWTTFRTTSHFSTILRRPIQLMRGRHRPSDRPQRWRGNHQYDMQISMMRSRPETFPLSAFSRLRLIRMAMPDIRIPWTSRHLPVQVINFLSAGRNGRTPPWSSLMTIRTAGTTIR